MIEIQRVYDGDLARGTRFLIDRVWPRGIKKEDLGLEAWLKDVAPSDRLRKWFGHDPAKWEEFRHAYFKELDANAAAWQPILEAARRGRVVLLYGARDREHNQAVALKQYLDAKLGAKVKRSGA